MCGASLSSLRNPQTAGPGELMVPTILARIKRPAFPARDFPVTSFGPKADGRTDCTNAFHKAIESCNRAGGGRVLVPAGEFPTSPIYIKSTHHLHVTKHPPNHSRPQPPKHLPGGCIR